MLEVAFRSDFVDLGVHMFVSWPCETCPWRPAGIGHAKSPWTVDCWRASTRQLRHVSRNLSRYFSPIHHDG